MSGPPPPPQSFLVGSSWPVSHTKDFVDYKFQKLAEKDGFTPCFWEETKGGDHHWIFECDRQTGPDNWCSCVVRVTSFARRSGETLTTSANLSHNHALPKPGSKKAVECQKDAQYIMQQLGNSLEKMTRTRFEELKKGDSFRSGFEAEEPLIIMARSTQQERLIWDLRLALGEQRARAFEEKMQDSKADRYPPQARPPSSSSSSSSSAPGSSSTSASSTSQQGKFKRSSEPPKKQRVLSAEDDWVMLGSAAHPSTSVKKLPTQHVGDENEDLDGDDDSSEGEKSTDEVAAKSPFAASSKLKGKSAKRKSVKRKPVKSAPLKRVRVDPMPGVIDLSEPTPLPTPTLSPVASPVLGEYYPSGAVNGSINPGALSLPHSQPQQYPHGALGYSGDGRGSGSPFSPLAGSSSVNGGAASSGHNSRSPSTFSPTSFGDDDDDDDDGDVDGDVDSTYAGAGLPSSATVSAGPSLSHLRLGQQQQPLPYSSGVGGSSGAAFAPVAGPSSAAVARTLDQKSPTFPPFSSSTYPGGAALPAFTSTGALPVSATVSISSTSNPNPNPQPDPHLLPSPCLIAYLHALAAAHAPSFSDAFASLIASRLAREGLTTARMVEESCCEDLGEVVRALEREGEGGGMVVRKWGRAMERRVGESEEGKVARV
ncbi:hypothetical protein JCM8097_005520 [Rhodosporidiobolus ruineniae]